VAETDKITLAELFAGDAKEHPSAKRSALGHNLALKIKVELSAEQPQVDWNSQIDFLAGKAMEMLRIPLVTGILVPAWRLYEDLDNRITDDGDGKIVWLAQHVVSSEHHPHLDVVCDGVHTAEVASLDVSADFTLSGFGLVVQRGKITKIRAGTIEGSGSLGFKSFRMEKTFSEIKLANEIELGEGIPLR